MKVYNSFGNVVEKFFTIKPGVVSMYICGPTVYDFGHLGHGRSMVCFDLIRRFFIYKGYDVNFVTNFTDIDDKMIDRANIKGISINELTDQIVPQYLDDFENLNILPPTHRPYATAYINEMLDMIHTLLDIDVAYSIDDGIYFDVAKFKSYGALSQQKLDKLKSGVRIEVNSQKRSPLDFVLWKFKKNNDPYWADTKGVVPDGRPGWHIECSAMSYSIFKHTFDIHAGGQDLIFPHHECEIAQSEICFNKKMANFWLHNGFVNVDGEKMSKSLNNFKTLKELFTHYSPLVVRYLLTSVHYRAPLDFTEESLQSAQKSLSRIHLFYDRVLNVQDDDSIECDIEKLTKYKSRFLECLENDFDSSGALGVVFILIKLINTKIDKFNALNSLEKKFIVDFFLMFNSIFAVLEDKSENFSDEVQNLIKERNLARKNKEFKKADELRETLLIHNVHTEDRPDGSVYRNGL